MVVSRAQLLCPTLQKQADRTLHVRETQRETAAVTLSRMSGLRTILSASGLIGVTMVGYGMWSLIAPGEDRRKELIKHLPESNSARMEETRKRNALVMQAIKDASETDENLARGLGPQYRR